MWYKGKGCGTRGRGVAQEEGVWHKRKGCGTREGVVQWVGCDTRRKGVRAQGEGCVYGSYECGTLEGWRGGEEKEGEEEEGEEEEGEEEEGEEEEGGGGGRGRRRRMRR